MSILQTFVHRLETRLPPAIEASTEFNLRDRTFAKIPDTGTIGSGGSSSSSLGGLGRHKGNGAATSRRNNLALVINDRNRNKFLIFVL
jgi:hypothetical protein